MPSEITLVVPTFGRPKYLKRLFSHYSDLPVSLIVVDGTESINYDESLHMASNASNIKYFHMPSYPISERIKFALSHIITPFSALMCDDEFHTLSGLSRSQEVLLGDSTIASSIGLCAGFYVDSRGKIVWGDYYNYTPTIFESNVPRRIESFLSHYSPTAIYALCRSDVFKSCMKGALAFEWSSSNTIEFAFSLLLLISGNHAVHDTLQWIRSDENKPIHSQLNRSVSAIEWYLDKNNIKEHKIFLKQIQLICSKYVTEYSHLSEQLFEMSFQSYIYREKARTALMKLGLMACKNYRRNYSQDFLTYFNSKARIYPMKTNLAEISTILKSISISYS